MGKKRRLYRFFCRTIFCRHSVRFFSSGISRKQAERYCVLLCASNSEHYWLDIDLLLFEFSRDKFNEKLAVILYAAQNFKQSARFNI